MRLKIQPPATWAQQNNPAGPATFCRQGSPSAFQVSWAEYRGGRIPEVTADSLKQMATDFGQKNNFGMPVDTAAGVCKFGSYGTAVFYTVEHPRIQVWFISDGRDHIMATHVCSQQPEASEIAEAQQIAADLALG